VEVDHPKSWLKSSFQKLYYY